MNLEHGSSRRSALVLVALALGVTGCATPIQHAAWLRVETAHFHLISGADEARTVEIARRLELLRAVLQVGGIEMNLEPRVPLIAYVFADSRSYGDFRPRDGIAGYMVPRPHRNFLVIDGDEQQEAGAIALHEYVHFVIRNGEGLHYPIWYDEGLAEFLSTVRLQDDEVHVGEVPPVRARWLLYGSPISLRRLVTAEDAYEWSDRALGRFYAQAWATTHFFQLADRVGFPKRNRQVVRYIALLNGNRDPDSAWQTAFATDFETIEAEFMRYIGEGQLPYLRLGYGELGVDTRVETAPLPEREKRYRLGELALAIDRRDLAERWLSLALETAPEDPRSLAALARVRSSRGRDDARPLLEQADALAPDDAEVQRLVGEAWLEAALSDEPDAEGPVAARRAREHFRRSLALEPGQPATLAGLGRAELMGADVDEAVAALRSAHEGLPGDRNIGLWLAEAEIQAGDPQRARRVIASMPPPSHGDPTVAASQPALERARLAAGLPARPPRATRHLRTRLDVDAPRPRQQIRGLARWVEVRGRGGLWESTHHDVVVAIDDSASTLFPTGIDLDGDGEVGKRRRPRGMNPDSASSDPDDTVIRAELEAAKVLIQQLDGRTTRVAVVTFAATGKVLAPLGTPEAALAALEAYEVHVDASGTSLANGLVMAAQEFFENRDVGVRRQRAVVLLSDGEPTVPSVRQGKRDALEMAEELGSLGVPIHAYALGEEALEDPEFYAGLGERSGGTFVAVRNPADVVGELAAVRFTGLREVTLTSLTLDRPGRAVRVFPDGSFDGFVPLVEGENVIEVRAVVDGDRTLSEQRTVLFERPEEPQPEDRRRAERLRLDLQERAVEIRLLSEMRRRRSAQTRKLEIEIDTSEPPAQ